MATSNGHDGDDAVPSGLRAKGLIEIYENERFWVGGGFSKRGLLPTDRHPYSTDDGSLSWKTLDEAATAMLGKGWTYDVPEFLPPVGEEEGWRYATDFSPRALQNAFTRRRMTDFVRRRKLVRRKKFVPSAFLPKDEYMKCQYCDTNVIETLSTKLLNVLSLATLLHQNNSTLTDAVAFRLKAKSLESLGIGSEFPPDNDHGNPAMVRLQQLYKELDTFPQKQQGVLSKANMFFDAHQNQDIHKKYIEAKYFSREERDAIAGLVIRHLDPEFNLHCDRPLCGEECEFYVKQCPNEGCDKRMSQKHLSGHDRTCGFKLVECPKNCGDTFPRNKQDVHLNDACSLRESKCPFEAVGCTAIYFAKDAPEHLEENASSHLLLAMNRMMEYQEFMSKLNARIENLEQENAQLKREVSTGTTKLAKEVANVSTRVDKVSKKVSHLESTTKSEFKKIQRAHAK